MTDYKLHNDCKNLSKRVYANNKHLDTNGWEFKKTIANKDNGFYSEVYTKNNKAILVIRGTEITTRDDFSAINMGLGYLPWQMKDAENAYIQTVRKYGKENVILTGHSLGGSEAQILGAKYGVETVTFNAYGVKNFNGVEINHTDNITNYGNAQDGVFVKNIDNQIGKTMILNTNAKNGDSFDKGYNYHGINPHFMENLGDLSTAIEYKRELFEDDNAPLFKMGIQYYDYNPEEVFDTKNRVLYKGEINHKDLEEGTPLYKLFIENMIDRKPMPTKKELDKRTRIGELIYVEEYTRSDGTKVSGYYRAYPRK